MRCRSLSLAAALLGGACSGPATPVAVPPAPIPRAPAATRPATSPPTSAPAPTRLAVDTTLPTGEGGSLTGTKGWWHGRRPGMVLLEDPSRELRIAVLPRKETTAAAAIAASWRAFKPGFALPPRHTMNLPPREGWDAITQIRYETPKDGRVAVALGQKKGGIWYVTLIDGTKASVERRSGELQTSVGSLKAPGVEEESFKGKTARPLDAERLRELERFAEAARVKLGLPGVGIALLQGGKVSYQKGLGVRELGKPAPVTSRTLFLIGSITKSMTSLMMAALVDRKKLAWDTPVTTLYPSFALGDLEATRKLTLQHTVCACTGLPRQDLELLFEYKGITPERRLEELRSMKPTTGFGEAFQYSNPMVSAGGYIAAHALYPKRPLGVAYDAAISELVFKPLGMKETTFDFRRAARADHATPHGMTYELTWKPLPLSDEEWLPAVRPAGGAWSNLQEMARYVLAHLNRGLTPEGKRFVSEKNLSHRYQPQARIAKDMSYGLGLVVQRSNGLTTISHSGGTAGFTTEFFFLPEHNFGAVILTNGGSTFFASAVRRKLLELLFDGRNEAQGNLDARYERLKEMLAKEHHKISFVPERAWLEKVAGNYENASLGKVAIRIEGARAIFDVGEWRSAVGKKRELDGALKVILTDPPWNDFELTPGAKDGRRTLLLETSQQKYLFLEAAAPR